MWAACCYMGFLSFADGRLINVILQDCLIDSLISRLQIVDISETVIKPVHVDVLQGYCSSCIGLLLKLHWRG